MIGAVTRSTSVRGLSDPSMDESSHLLRELDATRDHQKRRRIRQRLSALGPAAAPSLVEALKSQSDFTRWEAINLLGELRVEDTLRAVVQFAVTETERHAAWRALWAVSRFDRQKTIPLLLTELGGPPGHRRWRAALGLTMLDQQEAGEVLLGGLDSPDEWQVWEALGGLKALKLEGAEAAIARFLDPAKARPLRQQAVLALGAIKSHQAMSALEPALSDPHPQVRWRASMALAQSGPSVLPLLKARLPIETDETVVTQLRNDIELLGEGS